MNGPDVCNTENRIIRRTSSLCPVCFRHIPAVLERGTEQSGVYMSKACPEHGEFRVRIWNDHIGLEDWIDREEPLSEEERKVCNGDCRSCCSTGNDGSQHGQGTCCAILEVTKSCNLRCNYCFAYGGESDEMPSFEELCHAVDDIAVKGAGPLIQFAGGEPTLCDDLPELVKYAREAGCQYTQINTNGIRLAEDEDFVRRLVDAGLDIVFLQFDGTDDAIYRRLRGRDLLDIKLQAVKNCDKYHIGVTLVPTIVRGVNENALGDIIRKAAELFPAVRAVHFQPVTYLGRYPQTAERYTLDELMSDLCGQTGIPEYALLPSRCDHAMCEFHSTFIVNDRRQLIPMTDRSRDTRRDRTAAARNRQYVAEHWSRDRSAGYGATGMGGQTIYDQVTYDLEEYDPKIPLVAQDKDMLDFDVFVRKMKTHTLKISAMAFQDAMNIDLERLYRCSLHVYENGKLLPFCAKYLTPAGMEKQ